MLRKDYIMKLIQQLIESLFLLMNRDDLDDDKRKELFDSFYNDYLSQSQDYYLNASLDNILVHLDTKYGHEEEQYRIEMLSEIMYQDAMMEEESTLKELKLVKALSLFEYLENNSNTYSLVRIGRMDEIKLLLSKSY